MKYNKIPRINRVTKKQDGWRWDIRTYNKKTRRYEPVPVKNIPEHIRKTQDEELVKTFCQSKSAEEDAARFRAQLRVEWKKKYKDYNKLLEAFEDYQKERAPNSYKNDVYYLESYALHYFLEHKEANNHLNWSAHYDAFRNWLKTVKPLKWNREKLSLNTQNKIIKALNVFLEMVGRDNDERVRKCPQYKRSDMVQVSALDILEDDEIKKIQEALLDIRKDSHDLFTVLARTGMRVNEAIGLCMTFISEGHFSGNKLDKLHEQINAHRCGWRRPTV